MANGTAEANTSTPLTWTASDWEVKYARITPAEP